MQKRLPTVFCAILMIVLLASSAVQAQFQGGGNRNIPCKDSTPTCPCVLPNGDCFDIDTPIDDHLKILIVGGILIGLYKLHSSRKQQLNHKSVQ